MKLVPSTVNVTSPEPAVTVVGLMMESVGTGALTVKVCVPDVPPFVPGVVTVTGIEADDAI
jgi:hypothetical protein